MEQLKLRQEEIVRKLAVFGVRNDQGSTKAVVIGIKLEG